MNGMWLEQKTSEFLEREDFYRKIMTENSVQANYRIMRVTKKKLFP